MRWTATFTLAAVLAGHTLLETGRDALFLANIPAERLPWVYIAVALLALGLARVVSRGGSSGDLERRLALLQLLAASSVLGFWLGLTEPRIWLYYALYVWSGVITSIIVVTFWMWLGDLFTITQGKRLFASIAIGGAGGALGGSALATWIAPSFGAEALLLAAVFLFGSSTLGPISMLRSGPAEAANRSLEPLAMPGPAGLASGIRRILESSYAGRVAALVALAGATFIFADFLFKSVLAEEVAAEDLPTWLARIYFGLNLTSVTMLAVGVTPSVRRLGVDRAHAVLPALIAISTLGVLAGFALVATILLKASEGTLRHSLHKTATELLYLPMDSGLRSSVKGVIDLVGENAAKALASAAILLLVAMPEPRLAIAGALLVLSSAWIVTAARLRGPYLDVFRSTLKKGSIDTHIDFPELDIASLESLIRALSDRDDRAVLAAMELLVERDRCSLIPTLILYHPSYRVVERAIDIFASARRMNVLDFAERLLDHEYAAVRAAIVRASALLAPDREQLETLARDECPCIRVSAIAGLLAHGWIEPEEAGGDFAAAVVHREPDTRMAVANAAKLGYSEVYREPLLALARDAEPHVAREAVRAIRASADAWFTEPLVGLLDERPIRELVREVLVERDAAALKVLARVLVDRETPVAVARHIPGTLSQFGSPQAVDTLLRGLREVDSGMVRYKILRGLQPLMASPLGQTADRGLVFEQLEEAVDRTLLLLQQEVALIRGQTERPERATTGGRLLIDLLEDKRKLATGRIFLLLSLLHPEEDFRRIESGLMSDRAVTRASGFELLENLLSRVMGETILGIVTGENPVEKLRAARADLARQRLEYASVVRGLEADPSQAVQAFALYHAGEIDLEVPAHLAHLAPTSGAKAGPVASLRDQALEIIEGLPDALASQGLAPDETAGA